MATYRIKYSILGAAKYISHLDVAQVFERSMRRAGLPFAFSEGFNPHPKFSFGSALAVGVSSEGEYLDVELRAEVNPEEIRGRLNQVFPEGFRALEVQEVSGKGPTPMAILNRAIYHISIPTKDKQISQEDLDQTLNQLLNSLELKIIRDTKKGLKEKDIRPGIYSLEGKINQGIIKLNMMVMTGSEGNVRPEEVGELVVKKLNLNTELKLAEIHRQGLYVYKDEEIITAPWEDIAQK